MDLPLLTFGLMALVVVMTPGPTVLLALSNGSRFGLARSGYGILGAAISDGVLITAAALGLGAVLAASAFWFGVVKWIGVAYLVWIGARMLRSTGTLGSPPTEDCAAGPGSRQRCGMSDGASDGPGDRTQALAIFRKSFLVAVTNPKGYLFFTAFLPQFLILSDPLLPQYATLAVVFIAVDVAVMTAYAGLGVRAMRFLSDRGALWIDRACGGGLVALGIALAFVRRSAP